MKVEEYLELLTAIAKEHPNAEVVAFWDGNEDFEPTQFEAYPVWSVRDQVIFTDGNKEDDGLCG